MFDEIALVRYDRVWGDKFRETTVQFHSFLQINSCCLLAYCFSFYMVVKEESKLKQDLKALLLLDENKGA